jgi:hypothetical protein
MDILNFISWIKSSNYRATIPTDVPSLLVIGAKDPKRDDAWLSLALNADGLKPLYNKGTVTQITSATTAVTLNTASGVITSFTQTIATGGKNTFAVNNSLVTASSVILVSAQYTTAGAPLVIIDSIGAGSFLVTIANIGAVALNGVVKIHFFIVA